MSLRTRLALVFVVATLVPLGATLWLTEVLLDASLRQADQLSSLSHALENTGREYYRLAREKLKSDAWAGRLAAQKFAPPSLPAVAQEFWESGEPEGFRRAGDGDSQLLYLARTPEGVNIWTSPLAIRMQDLSDQYRNARTTVPGDLRRGLFGALELLAAVIWLVALGLVWMVATRFSRPIVNLTEALRALAGGNFRIRVPNDRTDEIGLATQAFNRTATELEQSRDRLVYLTQLASWQVLARKMAHEVKNSLTPIRLTVEEMVAREQRCRRHEPQRLSGAGGDRLWWMRSNRWSGASARFRSFHPNRLCARDAGSCGHCRGAHCIPEDGAS